MGVIFKFHAKTDNDAVGVSSLRTGPGLVKIVELFTLFDPHLGI